MRPSLRAGAMGIRLLVVLLALSVAGAVRPSHAFFFALSVEDVEESVSWYRRVRSMRSLQISDFDGNVVQIFELQPGKTHR